jgi:hypothetical protein
MGDRNVLHNVDFEKVTLMTGPKVAMDLGPQIMGLPAFRVARIEIENRELLCEEGNRLVTTEHCRTVQY